MTESKKRSKEGKENHRHHRRHHHHEEDDERQIQEATTSSTHVSNSLLAPPSTQRATTGPSTVELAPLLGVVPKSKVIRELKHGRLLKYKKRIFKSNWRETLVSLYSNATIVSRNNKADKSDALTEWIGGYNHTCQGETRIQMTNQTTLIIFGRQLKDVPKKPILPSGYRMEQLLAIGLIHSTTQKSIDTGHERMTILFHWFLSPTIHDLFDWIIAINNSIPDNKQIITNDELTMSLVMAEATHFNNLRMVQDSILAQEAVNDSRHVHGHDSFGPFGHDHHQSHHAYHHPLSHVGIGMTAADNLLYQMDYYSDGTTLGDMDMGDAGDAGANTFDCGGDFDDCSAFAAADAFAVF